MSTWIHTAVSPINRTSATLAGRQVTMMLTAPVYASKSEASPP
ncbi:MAG: hypothetical protein ABUK14_02990 [Desulfobacteria bacterium]